MAKKNQQYPDYLNPFDSDEESGVGVQKSQGSNTKNLKPDDYPDYLSPFGDDESNNENSATKLDDYDDSLNPFGDPEEADGISITNDPKDVDSAANSAVVSKELAADDGQEASGSNPFGDEDSDRENDSETAESSAKVDCLTDENRLAIPDKKIHIDEAKPTSTPDSSLSHRPEIPSPQPESLDPPPVPLPRTKSLLKKEQRNRQFQPQQLQVQKLLSEANDQASSILSIASTNSSSSIPTANDFQRKKNKRNAPPVPINYKRQVSGSLDDIEMELNEIGDKMAIIEQESNLCQETLKSTFEIDEDQFNISKSRFIELIKRKNSIVRRQKELMYRKRELKLDQIHSDIEYELRMIGNKQLSHRTAEDESKEKELLTKLVEIVEEKSDIVENLNKDTCCDSQDIDEAFRRLNISHSPDKLETAKDTSTTNSMTSGIKTKNKNKDCDKSSLAVGNKLSKIATLLPKSGTIKGTMKIKRKRLFKKSDSHQIER